MKTTQQPKEVLHTQPKIMWQPKINDKGEIIGHEKEQFFSFEVWRKKENLLADFPNCNPEKYNNGDIENPTFMDDEPDQPLHTQGELKVRGTMNGKLPFEIYNTSDNTTMAYVTNLTKSGSPKANAELIVRSCNNFDSMRGALIDALATLQRWKEHDPKAWDERDDLTFSNIETALNNTK